MFWTHKQESKIEKIQLKKQNQMLKVKSVGGGREKHKLLKLKKKKKLFGNFPPKYGRNVAYFAFWSRGGKVVFEAIPT